MPQKNPFDFSSDPLKIPLITPEPKRRLLAVLPLERRTANANEMIAVKIRWMIPRDMPAILDIERACFTDAWTRENFKSILAQEKCIGMVAEHNERIVGFMVYALHKTSLVMINFAVDPATRRRGVGRRMIESLVEKLKPQRRTEITLTVRESNIDFQLFLKKLAFRAVRVLRKNYADTNEDAYMMNFTTDEEREAAFLRFAPCNRISEYYVA